MRSFIDVQRGLERFQVAGLQCPHHFFRGHSLPCHTHPGDTRAEYAELVYMLRSVAPFAQRSHSSLAVLLRDEQEKARTGPTQIFGKVKIPTRLMKTTSQNGWQHRRLRSLGPGYGGGSGAEWRPNHVTWLLPYRLVSKECQPASASRTNSTRVS